MLSHIIIFALALVALVKSADSLVEYGARVARRFGVSDLVIGLTLTSLGTSVPELASAVSAALQENSGLIMGGVIGSNIANIGLIVGTAALVRPFSTDPKMHDRDGFILLAVSVVFFGLILDNHLGRFEAGLFLSLYVAYVAFLARSDRDKVDYHFSYFLEFFTSLEYVKPLFGRFRRRPADELADEPDGAAEPGDDSDAEELEQEATPTRNLILEIIAIVGACVGVVLGARYLIIEASWAARQLSVPESVIGLSLIAVGTSLPELTVAISAARRGRAEMVIGNVMGSNLANTLLILGVAGLINPLEIAEISVIYTVPIMLFFTLGLLYIVKSGWKVTRWQGALTLLAYIAFMATAFWQGWG